MREVDDAQREGQSRRISFRVIAGVVLLIALMLFALDNRDDTRVGWVFGDGTAPLAAVLAVTALAGALLGWLVLHRPQRRH